MNNEQLEALDKELAELLGWTCVYLHNNGKLVGTIPNHSCDAVIDRWTLDDGAAFRLMCEHNIDMGCDTQEDYFVGDAEDTKRMQFRWDSLEHKIQDIRVAIVQATINKLKGN